MITAVVAIAAIAPGVAFAAAPTPAAHAAKKKKKKKKVPLTATVSGTFTIKQNIEGGFGNDNGPNWQQLKVELKDAVVPFTGPYGLSAAAKATATFTYHAEAQHRGPLVARGLRQRVPRDERHVDRKDQRLRQGVEVAPDEREVEALRRLAGDGRSAG